MTTMMIAAVQAVERRSPQEMKKGGSLLDNFKNI